MPSISATAIFDKKTQIKKIGLDWKSPTPRNGLMSAQVPFLWDAQRLKQIYSVIFNVMFNVIVSSSKGQVLIKIMKNMYKTLIF